MNLNATQMALNMLKGKNPQMASYVEKLMKSGANPQEIISQGLKNGQISRQQIDQLKVMCRQFGIPTTEIDNIINRF